MPLAWALLSYRVPRQPSRLRLAIWRRLQRLGAVAAHDSVWILPADAKTREDFEWIAEEVEERGGSALLWEAASFSPGQDAELVARFRLAADQRYGEIADTARALGRIGGRRRVTPSQRLHAARQLRALDRAVRLERRRDYFRAPGRERAERHLAEALRRLGSAITQPAIPSQERSHAVGDTTALPR